MPVTPIGNSAAFVAVSVLGSLVGLPGGVPEMDPSATPVVWDFEASYDLSSGSPTFEMRGVISHAIDCLVEWKTTVSTAGPTTGDSNAPDVGDPHEVYRILGNYGLSLLRFERTSGGTTVRHDHSCDAPLPLAAAVPPSEESVDGERAWDTGSLLAPDTVLAEGTAPARLCARLGFLPTFAAAEALSGGSNMPFSGYMLASVRNSATDYIHSDLQGPYIAGTGPWRLPSVFGSQPEPPTDLVLGDGAYSPGWDCGGSASTQGTWSMRAEVLGLDPWGSAPLGTWRVVVDGRDRAP